MTFDEVSEKSRAVALALAVPLGVLGVHRFYVGKVGTGILMLLTGGGAAIWWIVDVIHLSSGDFTDRFGRRVTNWGVESFPGERLQAPEVVEELDAINEDLDDLSERLDRAEHQLVTRGRAPDSS